MPMAGFDSIAAVPDSTAQWLLSRDNGPSSSGTPAAGLGHKRTKRERLDNPFCGKKVTDLRVTHRLHASDQPTRRLTDARLRLNAVTGHRSLAGAGRVATHYGRRRRGARVPAAARSADAEIMFVPNGIGEERNPATQPLRRTFRRVAVTASVSIPLIFFRNIRAMIVRITLDLEGLARRFRALTRSASTVLAPACVS